MEELLSRFNEVFASIIIRVARSATSTSKYRL